MNLDFKFTAENEINSGRIPKEKFDQVKSWTETLEDDEIPSFIQDEIIVIFLIACQNNINFTKETIVKHYKYKKNMPELFEDRNMDRDDLKLGIQTAYMSSLPVRTNDNFAIHFFKLNDPNYWNFELIPLMKLSYMLVDITQEHSPPDGLIFLIDMKGFGLKHLSRLKPTPIRRFLQFLQEGLSLRISEIHVLNAVYFFDKLMNFLRLFMKSDLFDKIKSYSPRFPQEEFFNIIPKNCLPKDYGGDLPPSEELNQRTIEQFKNKQQFWKIEEQIRSRVNK